MDLTKQINFSIKWMLFVGGLLGASLFSFTPKEILPNKSEEVNINLSGLVYFTNCGFPFPIPAHEECDRFTIGTGVSELNIFLYSGYDLATYEGAALTTEGGFFSFNTNTKSNLISLIPELKGTNPGENNPENHNNLSDLGEVNEEDIALIQKHINDPGFLKCPFSRIAADANFDGVINFADINRINAHISGDTPFTPEESCSFAPNFLAPQSFTFQHITDFTDAFWSDDPGAPFNATLNLVDKVYTYKGDNSWMNGIKNWTYVANRDCHNFRYGFWAIRTGDVNGHNCTN